MGILDGMGVVVEAASVRRHHRSYAPMADHKECTGATTPVDVPHVRPQPTQVRGSVSVWIRACGCWYRNEDRYRRLICGATSSRRPAPDPVQRKLAASGPNRLWDSATRA